MQLKLIFVDDYEFEAKDGKNAGKKYHIYIFIDPNSLTKITGTDLNMTFEKYKVYGCKVEFNGGKLKVVSVQ